MRILCTYYERDTIFESAKTEVLIGRPKDGVPIDLDLSPDHKVSRPHARLGLEREECWIEDLDSHYGTQVNGVDIKGKGRQRIQAGDDVRIGETRIRVDQADRRDGDKDPATAKGSKPSGPSGPGLREPEPSVEIMHEASPSAAPPSKSESPEFSRRAALLYELPLCFAAESRLDSLLQTIVERLVDVTPGAARGALLLCDGVGGCDLLLKACVSDASPAVSETLARRAMTEQKGFIWRRGEGGAAGESIALHHIETGMYAPLVWQGNVLGAICVDNPERGATFGEEDLRLLLAASHYAGMAVANQQLQDRLRRETGIRSNLLRQFSPKVAEHLMGHTGRLRLGGERGEITILCADIRGFTKLSMNMEPDDIVEMLNEYYAKLVPIVFGNEGTIDKFIGDSILAVFGSPQRDAKQHERAVRTALEMQAAVSRLNTERSAREAVVCRYGIGIHCGEVIHGFVGTVDRMEFTVLGDAVNLASRYCDGARAEEILISPQVHQHVWRAFDVEQRAFASKHEGSLTAYSVKGSRA